MNLVIIADVASAERHTGDEAMLEAALTELRARGADSFTLIAPLSASSVPDDVHVVAPIGFGAQPGSAHDGVREARLQQVFASAPDDVRIAAVVKAVSEADAVVLSGGGNLSASWPHHLYERVALLEIAAREGVPAVVSGQTIGPTLTDRQRDRLGHALSSARFIGARDVPTFEMLREIGVASNAAIQVDDAITLTTGPVDHSLPEAYVALCVHQYDADHERVAQEIAALVVELHHRSGLPVVIFPNTAPGDTADTTSRSRTDDRVANDVAELVSNSSIVRVASITTATATADGIRRSAAVVSMRFHPLMFALAAGVPGMAITSDQYTGIKLEGALRHAGLTGWQVPTDALSTPIVAELFGELWARRSEITTHLQAVTPAWFDRHRRRWDAIWSAIAGDSASVATVVADPPGAFAELQPTLAAAHWSTAIVAVGRERLALADHRFDTAEEFAYSMRVTLEFRDQEIEGWRNHADDLNRRLALVETTCTPPTE